MPLQSPFNRHYIAYFVKENRSWTRWKNFLILIGRSLLLAKRNMAVILIVGLL